MQLLGLPAHFSVRKKVNKREVRFTARIVSALVHGFALQKMKALHGNHFRINHRQPWKCLRYQHWRNGVDTQWTFHSEHRFAGLRSSDVVRATLT
jgi:hypothetical protein